MKKVWAVLLALALIGGLSGCSSGTKTISVASEHRVQVDEEISPLGYDHFVNANLLELFGQYDEALQEYRNALKYIPESSTIRTDYARLLFRMKKTPQALDQAKKITNKDAEVYLLIGDCHRLLGNADEAIQSYREVVARDSDNVNAYWYLAGYYRQNEMNDSAIAAYYQLARLSDTYRIWQELGALLGLSGRYDESRSAYLNSINLNSDASNINSYLGLAVAYEQMDSLGRAEEMYDQALLLDSRNPVILRQLLNMYMRQENIEKAISTSEQLVALTPSDWVAQRRMGVLYYTAEEYEKADSVFQQRLEFGDDNILNYFYLGRIRVATEKYEEAKEYFQTVTEREKTFADGWLNLGFVYRQQDSLAKAIDCYNTGLDNSEEPEETARLLFALGAAEERNGQFYDAVETFKKLLDLAPEHAPGLNYLGYMLADRGEQLHYALKLIEKAMEISPENGAYIDSYAWVQYRLGNYDVALSMLKKAVDLINDDPVIFEHLGDVSKAMGHLGAAREYYQKVLDLAPNSIDIEEKLRQ